jgi:hypothetical protein
MSDMPTEELVMDQIENDITLYYTCPKCGKFCSRRIAETHRTKLEKAGVFTVDEMSAWIIEELEEEL